MTRYGRPFIGKSVKLHKMETLLKNEFSLKMHQTREPEPFPPPYHVIYHFGFGPESRRSRKLSDLSNLFEIVSDSLEKGGVIQNDRFIMSFDGSRKFDCPETYLEVFVLQFDEVPHD